jgi:hypothetical protein
MAGARELTVVRQRREASFAHALSASAVLAIGFVLATATSCAPPEREGTAQTKAVQVAAASPGAASGDLDVLFMIDDSSGMTSMQTKLAAQIPSFIQALENLPSGLPNIHIAVVSSDLGAPGDSTTVTCTTAGDQGLFRLSPSCTSSTLMGNATYVSSVAGLANYTGNLADVLACITPLGDTGCGFGHQLGSIARALGADGAPAPARNAGFLRPDADLAIIILSDADDCSAPPTTYLYSINNGQNNRTNAYGPMTHYRCNEFGHLCINPSVDPQKLIQPPLTPPLDAQGTPLSTLGLTDCESLDTDGLLTPVSTLVSGIRALKAEPDSQIFVGAIVAPTAPYTVDWVPPVGGQNLRPNELWPQIEPSCGAGDGSPGEPAVRIMQLVEGFGANGISTSICDPSSSYASLLSGLATKIGDHLQRGDGPATNSGAGGSGGAVAGGVGGAVATDAGLALTGGGGIQGTTGAGGSATQVKKNNGNGLMNGGCDIGASGPGTWGLTLLVGLLIARRRKLTGKPSLHGLTG